MAKQRLLRYRRVPMQVQDSLFRPSLVQFGSARLSETTWHFHSAAEIVVSFMEVPIALVVGRPDSLLFVLTIDVDA